VWPTRGGRLDCVNVAAFALAHYRTTGRWSRELLLNVAVFAIALFAVSYLLYEPFYLGFSSQFRGIMPDLVFKTPGARALVQRYGTVPASPKNMARALGRDAALLVYPGGDHETFRPSWESDEIDFAKRTGFVKLALEHRVPIVPVVEPPTMATTLSSSIRRVAKVRAFLASPPSS